MSVPIGTGPPVVCVAYIGRDNTPLLIRSFRRQADGGDIDRGWNPDGSDLDLHMQLFASMDQLDAQFKTMSEALQRGETKSPDPFLGVLTPALVDFEDHNIYAQVSASQVKVIAVVRDGVCKKAHEEEQVRSLLRQLLVLYTDAVANPFFAGLETEAFDKKVVSVVAQHSTRFF
mmetsp:Transcript_96264/g.269360  ORF Transcript_96264/g.269360 Transcript_96264/m.269360 type:complete len:174 (+) Transcript_96264:104-625(+)